MTAKRPVREDGGWLETHPLKPLLPLAFKLIGFFIFTGPRWIIMTIRLMIFAALLMPAWIRLFFFYLADSKLVRNIRYGDKPRQLVDIYLPEPIHNMRGEKRYPVVVFLTGGAWIIGYKAWGLLMGKILMRHGIITLTPDYRNFPMGTVNEMLEDASEALKWTVENIESYGGDVNQIYLAGQSAGAHLGMMSLIEKLKQEKRGKVADDGPQPNLHDYSLASIKGFIGISGPYDLFGLTRHLHFRGLHSSILTRIVGGKKLVEHYSVTRRIRSPQFKSDLEGRQFPPVVLFHGTRDKSVPFSSSEELATELKKHGISVSTKYYPGKTHTDPIIEDLMYVEYVKDDLMTDIIDVVKGRRKIGSEILQHSAFRRRPSLMEERDITARRPSIIDGNNGEPTMVPVFLIKIARRVNPF
eukprot:Colp12_sorted_trinity150504_noHs@28513